MAWWWKDQQQPGDPRWGNHPRMAPWGTGLNAMRRFPLQGAPLYLGKAKKLTMRVDLGAELNGKGEMDYPAAKKEKMRETIIRTIKAGNTRVDAYLYAGITSETFSRWIAADPLFESQIVQAEASAKVAHVTRLAHAAAAGSWQASVIWLERRYPREWGKIQRLDVNLRNMSDDDIKRYISRRLGLDEPDGTGSALPLPSGTGEPRTNGERAPTPILTVSQGPGRVLSGDPRGPSLDETDRDPELGEG